MDSKDIGNLGEHIAIVELLSAGIVVSRPLGDSSRYDLIIEIDKQLYTCQVKTTAKLIEGNAQFDLKTASKRAGTKDTFYDVDLFILVELTTKMVCILPNLQDRGSIWIKPIKPAVGVKASMNFAEDLTIAKFLESF